MIQPVTPPARMNQPAPNPTPRIPTSVTTAVHHEKESTSVARPSSKVTGQSTPRQIAMLFRAIPPTSGS